MLLFPVRIWLWTFPYCRDNAFPTNTLPCHNCQQRSSHLNCIAKRSFHYSFLTCSFLRQGKWLIWLVCLGEEVEITSFKPPELSQNYWPAQRVYLGFFQECGKITGQALHLKGVVCGFQFNVWWGREEYFWSCFRTVTKTTNLKPYSATSFTKSKTDILISIYLFLGSYFSISSKHDKGVLFNLAFKSPYTLPRNLASDRCRNRCYSYGSIFMSSMSWKPYLKPTGHISLPLTILWGF